MATAYKVTRSKVPHSENAGGTTIIYQTTQSGGNSQPFTPPSDTLELYQGPITVGDLLDIDMEDITPGMTWLVYANGQTGDPEGCWSTSTFTLDGETYQPGTFFTASFTRDDDDEDIVKFTPNYNPDLTNVVRMTDQPDQTWLFTNLTCGNPNTRSGYYNGIKLASLKHYYLDRGAKTLRPSYTYDANSRTDSWDLYVPYAHYTTSQGGTNTYYPGALSAEDYQRLVEGGGVAPGNGAITIKQGDSSWTFTVNQSTNTTIELEEGGSGVSIDTYFPTNPSDSKVPSTKLVKDTLDEYVTLQTNQYIESVKTFENNSFGVLGVWADPGTYAKSPAIKFISQTSSSAGGNTIGWIGVQMYDWSSYEGYPAFWTSQGGTPQQIVRVSERGDTTHGVYIDAQGFTKQCTGGGGSSVNIDTSWPTSPANDHVPSSLLVSTTLDSFLTKAEAESTYQEKGSYVTRNTEQVITAKKTFTKTPVIRQEDPSDPAKLDFATNLNDLMGSVGVISASGTTYKPVFIQPNETTQNIAHTTGTAAVGSTNTPVYVDANGVITSTGKNFSDYALKSEIPTKQTVLDWGFVNRCYVTFHRTYAGQSGWPFEIVASRGVSSLTELYNGRTCRVVFDDITTSQGIYTFLETHSIRAFQVVKSTHKYYELPIVEARYESVLTEQGSKPGLGIYVTSGNTPLPYQEEEVNITFIMDTL